MKFLLAILILLGVNVFAQASYLPIAMFVQHDTTIKKPDTALLVVLIVEKYDTAFGDVIFYKRNGPMQTHRGYLIVHSRTNENSKQAQIIDARYFDDRWRRYDNNSVDHFNSLKHK